MIHFQEHSIKASRKKEQQLQAVRESTENNAAVLDEVLTGILPVMGAETADNTAAIDAILTEIIPSLTQEGEI